MVSQFLRFDFERTLSYFQPEIDRWIDTTVAGCCRTLECFGTTCNVEPLIIVLLWTSKSVSSVPSLRFQKPYTAGIWLFPCAGGCLVVLGTCFRAFARRPLTNYLFAKWGHHYWNEVNLFTLEVESIYQFQHITMQLKTPSNWLRTSSESWSICHTTPGLRGPKSTSVVLGCLHPNTPCI